MNRPTLKILLLVSLVWGLLVTSTPALAVPPGVPPQLTSLYCSVTVDDQPYGWATIYVNREGKSMLSMADTFEMFSCNFRFQDDGSALVNHMYVTQIFSPQQYLSALPLADLEPADRMDSIYLPLREVAEGFGYKVNYYTPGPTVALLSPGYQQYLLANPPVPPPVTSSPKPPSGLSTWGTIGGELSARWPGHTLLGSYYTALINSPAGRTNNIRLSAGNINGTILEPGAVFSFNRTVGRRTIEAGYKEAPIFVGQEIENEVGGGICQTATTMYNAALESGMQVIERHTHSMPVKYAPPGRDATVYWGVADLKFKNTLDRPVQILAEVYGSYVLIGIAEVGQR